MIDEKRFALRLPPELYDAIGKRATLHHRSVNNEIIVLLKLGLVCEQDESIALPLADTVIKSMTEDGNL